jgi:hypothetical protein
LIGSLKRWPDAVATWFRPVPLALVQGLVRRPQEHLVPRHLARDAGRDAAADSDEVDTVVVSWKGSGSEVDDEKRDDPNW